MSFISWIISKLIKKGWIFSCCAIYNLKVCGLLWWFFCWIRYFEEYFRGNFPESTFSKLFDLQLCSNPVKMEGCTVTNFRRAWDVVGLFTWHRSCPLLHCVSLVSVSTTKRANADGFYLGSSGPCYACVQTIIALWPPAGILKWFWW